MKRAKFALPFIFTIVSANAMASHVTFETLNKKMFRCYQQTLKLDKSPDPQSLNVRHCNTVIKNDWTHLSTKAAALLNRGLMRGYQGDIDRALLDFERASRLDSTLLEPHLAAAQLYHRNDQLKQALHHYNKAIEKGANDAAVIRNHLQVSKQLNKQIELAKQVH
jgi:tetratricopeptide (TPR) repeat protein